MYARAWFALLVVAILSIGRAAQAQETPSRLEPLREQPQGPPLWISAEAVSDAEEIINLELVDSLHLRGIVEKLREDLGERAYRNKAVGKPGVRSVSRSECSRMSGLEDDRGGWEAITSTADVAANARSILRGIIREVTPGFYRGIPDSLLRVEVQEIIKGSSPATTIYIDYQVAHFRVGPYIFCNARSGYEPSPGDSLLLLDYVGTVDRDDLLFAPRPEQVIFERRGGGLFFSSDAEYLAEINGLKTLDEVAGRLRNKIEAISRSSR